ncbi:MAG: LamG-like jellyroll fold domain-containing protein [Bacteroidales bacterium]
MRVKLLLTLVAVFFSCSVMAQYTYSSKAALSLNGTNTYATCGAINTTNFTIEAWVNPLQANSDQAIISTLNLFAESGCELHISDNNKPVLTIWNGEWLDLISPNAIDVDKWIHVAGTYDGTTAKLYVNGDLVVSKNASSYTAGGSTLSIGIRSSGSYMFKGMVDECRIWDRALDQNELQNQMHALLDGTQAGLKAYYQCNEESGTSLVDKTNAYNATIYGTPTWAESYALCPFLLNVTNVKENSFSVNWKDVKGAESYSVDVDDNSDFSSPIVSAWVPSSIGTSSNFFATLTNGVKYYYRVRVLVNGLFSPSSEVKSFMLAPGNSLFFDGADDFVSIPALGTQADFTFETWFNASVFTSGDYNGLFNTDSYTTGSPHIQFFNGQLGLWIGGCSENIISDYNFNPNRWYHVAITYSSTNKVFNLYVNGNLANTVTISSTAPVANFTVARMGSYLGSRYFKGQLDEYRIWNVVRTEDEIKNNISKELVGNELGLLVYYNFDEGVASSANAGLTSLKDKSTNNFNGTLTSFALSGSISNFVESYAMVVPKAASATNILKTKFTANWSAPETGKVEKYYLDVAYDKMFAIFLEDYYDLDCGTNLSKEISGLTPNRKYYYRVRAYKSSVIGYGGFCDSIPVTTLNASVTPIIAWENPADITYGTALGDDQLNAVASYNGNSVSGSYTYLPAKDSVMNAGNNQDLCVVFTPTDSENYGQVKDTVHINVLKVTPLITWENPEDITYGTRLSLVQLNASASSNGHSLAGLYVYSHAFDSLMNAGNNQDLSVNFIPSDLTNYNNARDTVQINVLKATPTITWENPSDITYGTPLSATQLNATASYNGNAIEGTFTYSTAIDSVLNSGNNQDLTVEFIPTDAVNYESAKDTVQINVLIATPVITWENPEDIIYGTPLSATQLNATASINGNAVDGVFTYSPAINSVLNADHFQNLTLEFVPTDLVNCKSVRDTVQINVLAAPPVITWADPADIYYGTPLGSEQLNATASFNGQPVAGTFSYMPMVGTLLEIGNNQRLLVIFNPTDQQNFTSKEDTAFINVLSPMPEISWENPSDIIYGTPLSATQLNAEVIFKGETIEGTLNYSPDFDSILNAGSNQKLKVEFIPTDLTRYASVKDSVQINVLKADPVITWDDPDDIVYGTLLDDAQLNAVADIPGIYTYYPASGTQINPGSKTLSLTFTPTDINNYNTAVRSVYIYVLDNPLLNSYCEATSIKSSEFISNVKLGDINQSSQSKLYENFTAQITDLERGTLDTLEIEIGNLWMTDQVLVWIDWNQDGDFDDENENVYTSSVDYSNPLLTNFAIPLDAKLGRTRMRIRLHDAVNDFTNNTPCGNSTWGEVEDYAINVVPVSSSMQLISGSNNVIDSVAYVGMKNEKVLRMELLMNGGANPLELTSMLFGVKNPEKMTNAKVFYTGSSETFSDSLQLGTNVSVLSGEFEIQGLQKLCGGMNYFWLCYDINGDASVGDTITTQCTKFTIGGIEYTPDMISGETVIRELTFELSQNINPVYPGETNQDIIGVIVDNKGTQSRMLNSIAFNVDGTSDISELSNLKVFTTGSQNHFASYKQYGQTVSNTSGICAFADDIDLVPGKNYLWFTSDISESAVNNHLIDAGLVAMSINSLSVTPTETSPDSARIVSSFSGNTFANFMPASMVIGQPDFYTQDLTIDQDGGYKACGVAISSNGMVAMVSQTTGYNGVEYYGGRVLLWNSVPENDGTPADIVIGQSDFTSTYPMGCSPSRFSTLMSAAFSPDGNKLLVADLQNNRILVFDAPFTNGMEASVVVGQTSFYSSVPGCSASNLNSPYSVYVSSDGKMFITDAGNNRVLIYNQIPTVNGVSADVVVGQTDFISNISACSQTFFQMPSSCTVSPNGKLIVCDAGNSYVPSNSRILIYNEVPESNGAPADVVIGHPDFTTQALTSEVTDSTMFYPYGVSVSKDGQLAVGEFGSSRVLIYDSIPTTNGAKANIVLGQPNFNSNLSFNGGISDRSMKRPYNIAYDLNGRLFVSGRDMHRIMVYGEAPALEADLELNIGIDYTYAGTDFTHEYVITLRNNGANTASNVQVKFELPSQFDVYTIGCNGVYDTTNHIWTLPQIEMNQDLELRVGSILKDGHEGETIRAIANILYSDKKDPNLENNSCFIDYVNNIVWTGSVSISWNDPLNWKNGKVPTAYQSVLIPGTPEGNFFPEAFDALDSIYNINIENGAYINIPDTCELAVFGNFTSLSDSTTGSGDIIFKGNSVQSLKGKVSSMVLYNDKNVSLSGNSYVRDAVSLLTGKLILGDYNLQMGDTAKFVNQIFGKLDAKADFLKLYSSYVVTNGTGYLIQKVDTAAKEFPVGTEDNYYGATVTNNGVADNYSVRVFPNVLEKGTSGNQVSDIDHFIKVSWNIEEELAGGSDLNLELSWNTMEMLLDRFDKQKSSINSKAEAQFIEKYGIGYNNGTAWDKPSLFKTEISKLEYISYRDNITTMGTFAIGDSSSRLVLKTSPVLMADYTDNDPLHSITITYESNVEWSLAINNIWVNGVSVGSYNSDSQSITIPASYFPVGDADYQIEISATDYTIARLTQFIKKVDQEIHFDPITGLVVNEPFILSAQATSGLDINYVCSNLNIATIDGSTLTPLQTGSAIIIASQKGDNVYNAAVSVQHEFISYALGQTITFNTIASKTYGDASFVVTATGGATDNPVVFTSSDTTIAKCSGVSGEIIALVGAGTCKIYANQAGDATYAPALQQDQELLVNAKNLTTENFDALDKIYDGTTTATLVQGQLVGVINDDDIELLAGTVAFVDANAGNDKALVASGFTMQGDDVWKYNLVQPDYITANIFKADPVITWSNPADITYGTLLSETQLNATADMEGGFIYTPASGTKLNAGNNQLLGVDFTPTDALNYNSIRKTVSINVSKADPVITWSNPADITYGTLLSETQLNATANVEGTFTYNPAAGTKLEVGNNQELKADFTPTDAVNYNNALKSVFLNVLEATGIEDLDMFELSVYPNPAVDQISIKDLNEIENSGNLRVEIVNANGKTYCVKEIHKDDLSPIDIQALPSGIYILKIVTDSKIRSVKFIKQ